MATTPSLNKFEISLAPGGVVSRVVLNGRDVSSEITSISIMSDAKHGTRVQIEYPASEVIGDVSVLGDAVARRMVFQPASVFCVDNHCPIHHPWAR